MPVGRHAVFTYLLMADGTSTIGINDAAELTIRIRSSQFPSPRERLRRLDLLL